MAGPRPAKSGFVVFLRGGLTIARHADHTSKGGLDWPLRANMSFFIVLGEDRMMNYFGQARWKGQDSPKLVLLYVEV